MRTLRFSAEASLYISSGHYRTGEHALSLFRETNRLRPAMERGEVPPITVPGETIPVHSCPPGWQDLGGICWPPPQTEPPSGGGGPGTPGFPGEPSGNGPPGPGGETPERPRPDPMSTPGKAWAAQCKDEEDPIQCCLSKEKSCLEGFPLEWELCRREGEVCMSNVRDVGKAWAAQCKDKEDPVQCCESKAKSCREGYPKKKELCNKYGGRCLGYVLTT
jgi:hypothetical protein